MKDFADIKKEESKYGKFLHRLETEHDLRNSDERWDLRYFYDNTEFCRDSAKHFLEKLREQRTQLKKFHAREEHDFTSFEFRITFGCFCFYLYASLESFAHEINILYELRIDRSQVKITGMGKELEKNRKESALYEHFESNFSDPDFKKFLNFRNAIAHGYVYPISYTNEGIFVRDDLKTKNLSFEEMNTDLVPFCERIYSKIFDFICKGWRCFDIDELADS